MGTRTYKYSETTLKNLKIENPLANREVSSFLFIVKKERKITKTETRIQYSIGNQLKNLQNATFELP